MQFLRFAVLGIKEHPRRARRTKVARIELLLRPAAPERDWAYMAWIRKFPCAACETLKYIEAAHTGLDGGMRLKSSDHSCVPLCAVCHRVGPRAYHVIGRDAFEDLWKLNFVEMVKGYNGEWAMRRPAQTTRESSPAPDARRITAEAVSESDSV